MKTWSSLLILVVAVVAAVAIAAAPDEAQQRRASAQLRPYCTGFQALFDEIDPEPLSVAEEEWALSLYEEEKLARDVYTNLAERWQLPVFANIARTEQQHTEMVVKIIDVYGLDDQIPNLPAGEFNDLNLQYLYETYTTEGTTIDLVGGLTVGAEIEVMSLAHLLELIEFTENRHFDLVAYNLAKDARNHLRTFVWALEAQGTTFTQNDLDPAFYAEVIEQCMERRIVFNADGEEIPACGAEAERYVFRRRLSDGEGPGGGGGGGNGGGGGGGN